MHIEVSRFARNGFGFTVTVTRKAAPVQLPDEGVTVLVAVCAIFVGLACVPFMFTLPLPAAPPAIPPVTDGAPQE